MELDDLKDSWNRQGDHLVQAPASVPAPTRRRMRLRLVPGQLQRLVELVVATAGALVVGMLLVRHLGELRYLVAGGALFAWLAAAASGSAHQFVRVRRIDFAAPIADMQRLLGEIQLAEARGVVLAIAGGVLIWLPALLLLFEAVTGVSALARIDGIYLLANLTLGAAVLVFGHFAARRYLTTDLGPWARHLVEALTGHGIRRARKELTDLITTGE